MVTFYSGVFGIEFTSEPLEEHNVYTGTFSGLEFTLVPVELTGITDQKNPTHSDIYVSDLEEGIALVEEFGGRTNGQLGEDDRTCAIGVFDPDGNFMVLKQMKVQG